MANPNHIRNGGFEHSTPPALPPFWSGTGSTETDTQLLGDNNARLNVGETISQALLPLQVGQIYQFKAAFSTDTTATTGTIDIGITGITTRNFQGTNIEASEEYVYYSFDFTAAVANPTLIIANNTNTDVIIDVVSVKLTNPNRVQNGGFEQSIPPALPFFWSGTGSTETGGTQLLGDNNARLTVGETISQALLPLQVGKIYTFQAAFFADTGTGTIDIGITGITTRNFQSVNVNSSAYSYYSFDFTATVASPTLIIANNTDSDVLIDVVSVKLTNPNRVQNGGFEQSIPPALPFFWSGTGSTETGGTQLLGDNNALLDPGERTSQALLPLQVGEIYQFQAAFDVLGNGTIDIEITGTTTRNFQSFNMVDAEYAYYSFDFIATVASPTLTITNNTDADVQIDVVSVKLA